MIHLHDTNNLYLLNALGPRGAHAIKPSRFGQPKGQSFVRTCFNQMQYAPASDFHIWVADGAHGRKKRRHAYPEYKAHRKPFSQDVYSGLELFIEVMKLSRAAVIRAPEWEADDVIATIARQYALRGELVTIHANDGDFAQLLDFPGISAPAVRKPEHPPVFVPLYKALVGDPSDNIPGLPGFGETTWKHMSALWPDLNEAVRSHDLQGLLSLGLPGRCERWLLADPANFDLIGIFYDITHFLKVPDTVIEENVVVGTNNPAAAEALMQKYML